MLAAEVVLEANVWFVAAVVVAAIAATVGGLRMQSKLISIDKAVNSVPAGKPPIKEHAEQAARSSQRSLERIEQLERQSSSSCDRLAEIERRQTATFDRLDKIDGRLDGHSVHLAGIGARVSTIADHILKEDPDA